MVPKDSISHPGRFLCVAKDTSNTESQMLMDQNMNFQEFFVEPPTALLTAAFSVKGKQYLNVFLFQTN